MYYCNIFCIKYIFYIIFFLYFMYYFFDLKLKIIFFYDFLIFVLKMILFGMLIDDEIDDGYMVLILYLFLKN